MICVRPMLEAKLPIIFVAAALGLPLALGGCASFEINGAKATLTYTEDAGRAYGEAMEAFRAKDWESAKALFGEVQRLFPYTRYARLSELRVADVAFEEGRYTDAIASYRGFVQAHRNDENVEYAKYRIAKALFFDVDDTFLLPPMEERDQATTLDAYREIRSYLKQFPRTRYQRDLEYMLQVVTGRLVRHELYVARFYLRSDDFDAVIARIDYALQRYPESDLVPEALVLKGETLMKMHRWAEARKVLGLVVSDHASPFATTAKDLLDELKSKPQADEISRR